MYFSFIIRKESLKEKSFLKMWDAIKVTEKL